MVDVSRVNLDRAVWNRVHAPLVDGAPLYRRVENSQDVTEASNKTEKWLKTVERAYNSPSNIRKLWITSKFIAVKYYKPMVGGNTTINVQSMAKLGIDEALEECSRTGQPLRNVKQFNGNPLAAIYSPWVCSNIEEIYFDHTELLGDVIHPMCVETLQKIGIDPNQYNMLDVAMQAGTIPLEAIRAIFNATCLKYVLGVRDRYPRLKVVGYVSNLAAVYQQVQLTEAQRKPVMEDFTSLWCDNDLIQEMVAHKKATIWKLTDVWLPNNKFRLSVNMYNYDNDVLQPYFDKLKLEMDEYVRKRKAAESAESTNNDEDTSEAEQAQENDIQATSKESDDKQESQIEKLLNTIAVNCPEPTLKSVMAVAFKTATQEDKQAILNDMTDKGKERYIKYI